jgi:alkaline phosphatase
MKLAEWQLQVATIEKGIVQGAFPTGGHTAVMVPMYFSYGPGPEEFIGIMENTEVHSKMKRLLLDN